MAVINAGVNLVSSAAASVAVIRSSLRPSGADVGSMYATFEVAAGDDDASVYRVFTAVPNNVIPTKIMVANDAITGGTDYVLGLYDTNTGAVISANCFMTTLSMASAKASLNPKTAADGMVAVAIENYYRRLWEHAGHTTANLRDTYDIAFTANTVGTGAGTISILLEFVLG